MIPELGHFALILALLVAIAQGTLPLVGAQRRDAALMAIARPAALAQFFLVAFAFGCLAYSFATNDFSVELVAQHSNSQLPLQYRIAATWGSHEGSLLLWVLMLTGWATAVTLRSRNLPADAAGARAGRDGARRRRLPAVPAVHVEPVPAAACPPRPKAATSTRCCRTPAW